MRGLCAWTILMTLTRILTREIGSRLWWSRQHDLQALPIGLPANFREIWTLEWSMRGFSSLSWQRVQQLIL